MQVSSRADCISSRRILYILAQFKLAYKKAFEWRPATWVQVPRGDSHFGRGLDWAPLNTALSGLLFPFSLETNVAHKLV